MNAELLPQQDEKPIRFVTDERLDFNHVVPLRKSYLIASSYRSGSQYLCWQLWETGVLGAPCEYLNPGYELRLLKTRFNVFSHADYITKLLEHRTSRNGIFGMKEHFHHFESFIKEYPEMLEVLSPVTYIYISRQDRIAQAVSMAKALQTNWWSSRMEEGEKPPLNYDRDLIGKCVKEVELQDAKWQRWFDARRIAPHPLTYEGLTADAAGAVRGIVELLGVQDDPPEQVRVPPARKQSDDTNKEWIERFERETRATSGAREHSVDEASGDIEGAIDRSRGASVAAHFCDRYDRLVETLPEGTNSATGFIDAIRLRRRYDAIIAKNRGLLQNARVLDLLSSHGFWTLAALDAGAAHVVGVETSPRLTETAAAHLAYYGIKQDRYRFVTSEIFDAMEGLEPGAFDVILCKGFLEQCYLPELFRHLHRLAPKHVILDTRIAPGVGPLVRFALTASGSGMITATPNHEVIAFLCSSDFKWSLVEWQAMGISDWTGIQDYASDRQRTYVLDRL